MPIIGSPLASKKDEKPFQVLTMRGGYQKSRPRLIPPHRSLAMLRAASAWGRSWHPQFTRNSGMPWLLLACPSAILMRSICFLLNPPIPVKKNVRNSHQGMGN